MNRVKIAFRGCLLLLILLLQIAAQAQTNTVTFGQNRVQYKDFTFQYYESDNFITHFYQGGQDVAKYTIKTAEDVSDEIATLLDFKYRRKIDIIVYNTINELNQTNIGIYEQGQVPGGTTKLPENKMFVYFNGDHRHLDKQIREGIAKIYLEKMVLGSNFAEVVQNAVLLNLPDWYKQGLIKYIGEGWNSDTEDRLRDGILSGRFKRLQKLQPEEALFVGHSIWHYVEEVHGKSAVSNIIYLTRINRSVDNGFLFVLGTNLEETLRNWYVYYYNRFNAEKKITQLPSDNSLLKARIRNNIDYYQPRMSADGKLVAYVSNDMGRCKIHLLNTETGNKKIIHRVGFRTNTLFTDQSVPLLAWEPSGKKLAFISEKRAQIFLRLYNIETGKTEKFPVRKFQKVVSFNYVDAKQLVMSAVNNGQSDIYLYNIASTTTRKLTDDYFDDLYPAYIQADSAEGILFSSNRPDDTLRNGRYESQNILKTHDLFFYDLSQSSLYRITNTPLANETYPQPFSEQDFCFLSEQNGTRNRFIGHFEKVFSHNEITYQYTYGESGETDSVKVREGIPFESVSDKNAVSLKKTTTEKIYTTGGVTAPYSNFTYNIREQCVVPQKNLTLDLTKKNGKPVFYRYDYPAAASGATISEYMQKLLAKNLEEKKPKEPAKEEDKQVTFFEQKYDSSGAVIGSRPYDFQSEFDYGIKLFDWDSASSSRIENAQEGYVFRFSRVRPYFVRFAIDKVITQVDNNILMTRYQPFNPSNPQFDLNPVSFMFKFGITDLLENHKVYGGIRLPFVGLNSTSEYFITYENLTKRLDVRYTFYRRSQGDKAFDRLPFSDVTLPPGYSVDYSIKTNYAEIEMRYPIDVLNRISLGIAFRNDKVVYKAADTLSLNLPSNSDNWLFARGEYVFDNCLEVMTNIRYGTRFKVFGEIHKQFPTQNKVLFDRVDFPVVQFNNRYLGVVGFDLRHYQKIYKQIIWANRLAFGASLGTSRLIYYLGGLDNWIGAPRLPKFDPTTPVNRNNNYAFQTLATPLRGYAQNARNGDKYIVLNSELRIPLFAALMKSPIRSELIKNFQVVGFLDVGTAWEGASPFADSNPLFTEEIPNAEQNPSVIVRVKRYKTPIVMGFGPGLRTSFLGFFLRFDAAWSYDTGEVSKKPLYYFSFGLDF